MTTRPDLRRPAATRPRVANRADAPRVTQLLVDAFARDPMWSAWAFPGRIRRRAHRRAVFQLLVDGALRYPWTWLAGDDLAVAMWIPPDETGLSADQEAALEDTLRTRLGNRQADRILAAFQMFEAVTPTEPHYYLSLLGTDRAHTRRGHAGRLLAHNLALLDAEGAPAYLDCADDLVGLYARFGFRRISSIVLPEGPRSNGMWRVPRTDDDAARGERDRCSCRRAG